jgi:hypothetical protein
MYLSLYRLKTNRARYDAMSQKLGYKIKTRQLEVYAKRWDWKGKLEALLMEAKEGKVPASTRSQAGGNSKEARAELNAFDPEREIIDIARFDLPQKDEEHRFGEDVTILPVPVPFKKEYTPDEQKQIAISICGYYALGVYELSGLCRQHNITRTQFLMWKDKNALIGDMWMLAFGKAQENREVAAIDFIQLRQLEILGTKFKIKQKKVFASSLAPTADGQVREVEIEKLRIEEKIERDVDAMQLKESFLMFKRGQQLASGRKTTADDIHSKSIEELEEMYQKKKEELAKLEAESNDTEHDEYYAG